MSQLTHFVNMNHPLQGGKYSGNLALYSVKPDYQQDGLASAPHIGKSLGRISLEEIIKECWFSWRFWCIPKAPALPPAYI